MAEGRGRRGATRRTEVRILLAPPKEREESDSGRFNRRACSFGFPEDYILTAGEREKTSQLPNPGTTVPGFLLAKFTAGSFERARGAP